ncbi:MAG: hypothetical protein ACTSXC_08415 [Candidatus Freyarchaeota archaeon]
MEMIKKLTNADVTMRRGPKHSSVMIVESSELGHLFIEMGFRPGKKPVLTVLYLDGFTSWLLRL